MNGTIRPWNLVAFKVFTASTRRLPEAPLALTRTRRLLASMPAMTRPNCSSDIAVGWWLWMSMTGNFACGTGCCGTILSVVRGLYWVIVGSGNSGARPSPGRRSSPGGRPWLGCGGACSASTSAAPVSTAAASQIVDVRMRGGPWKPS